jgi:hypothetical protein
MMLCRLEQFQSLAAQFDWQLNKLGIELLARAHHKCVNCLMALILFSE